MDNNMEEKILVLDCGGQYNRLIARRVRENNVYSEVLPATISLDEIKAKKPSGIIFTGGPKSVNDAGAVLCDHAVFTLGVPVLGICYGAQMMTKVLGGSVVKATVGEYGNTMP